MKGCEHMSDFTMIHLPLRLQTAERVSEDGMKLINMQSLNTLNAEEIYTFQGIASHDRMDSHFTRMDPKSTLKNYAADLKEGIPLLEWHDTSRNPYGRSFNSELAKEDDSTFVRGHWYVLRDLVVNGNNTNQTIRAIESGIVKDMSVGFGGQNAWFKCGVCNRNLFDWNCEHIPGMQNESGERDFAWIMDANLREVSTVYKGSAPGAYIEKVRAYVEQGQLEENKIRHLEQQFQVRFERKDQSFFMPKKKESALVEILEQLRTALTEGKLEKKSVYEVLQNDGETYRNAEDVLLRNELGEVATVEGIKQLKADAEHGKSYIIDLVERAVQARTKVQGNDFKADQYRAMLARSADIEFLKDEIESYEKQVKEKFTGGRQSQKETLGGDQKERTEFKDENLFA